VEKEAVPRLFAPQTPRNVARLGSIEQPGIHPRPQLVGLPSGGAGNASTSSSAHSLVEAGDGKIGEWSRWPPLRTSERRGGTHTPSVPQIFLLMKEDLTPGRPRQ
jgi:hypothetical protein